MLIQYKNTIDTISQSFLNLHHAIRFASLSRVKKVYPFEMFSGDACRLRSTARHVPQADEPAGGCARTRSRVGDAVLGMPLSGTPLSRSAAHAHGRALMPLHRLRNTFSEACRRPWGVFPPGCFWECIRMRSLQIRRILMHSPNPPMARAPVIAVNGAVTAISDALVDDWF